MHGRNKLRIVVYYLNDPQVNYPARYSATFENNENEFSFSQKNSK